MCRMDRVKLLVLKLHLATNVSGKLCFANSTAQLFQQLRSRA